MNKDDTTLSSSYIYGDNSVSGQKTGLIYGVKLNGTQQIGYEYDELTRMQQRLLYTTTPYITEYTYLEGAGVNTTTTLVKSIKNGNDTLTYTYDEVGNITSVSKNGTIIEEYTYDAQNQLTSATYGGNTYTYSYDNGGNITEIKKNDVVIKTYTYGNSEWKDQLTGFNGETITYDEIGNPLTYRGGMTFTWQNGRQLASVSMEGTAAIYTYDADGLRTSKTVNGTTTEYYWLNGTLYGQKTGDESIFYLYDENGTAYGLILQNGAEKSHYYYEFNLQGDIIGIIDSTGTKVVEYTYGAWGDILSITGTLVDTIGQKNPLRYRGYYYDEETGFYYLANRYCDTEVGRLLNADGYVSTGVGLLGYNMFAYCNNNPALLSDSDGTRPVIGSSLNNESKKERTLSFTYMKQLSYYTEVAQTQVKLQSLGFRNVSFASASDYLNTIKTHNIESIEVEAQFLAHCAYETSFGRYLTELGSAEYFSTKKYGYKYRGAGYIQLTWDYNYQSFANYMGDSNIYNLGAEYVAQNYAWAAAGWWWSNNNMNYKIINGATIRDTTLFVRGSYGTWESRQKYYSSFYNFLR